MVRNRNLDRFRAIALLLVLVYHCWTLTGEGPILPGLYYFVKLGGEIGVTAFFALSGYGIYCSLSKREAAGELSFLPFMKSRMRRIAPQYYISLILVILLTNAAYVMTKQEVGNVLTHLVFLHNLFPHYTGGINGVLWTMGTIVQFYVVAIPLYKGMNRTKGGLVVVSILFTVLMKWFMFHGLNPLVNQLMPGLMSSPSGPDMFWRSRQLYTSLDNFVIGMGAAYFVKNHRREVRQAPLYVGVVLTVAALYFVCKYGLAWGIHTDNLSGYFWHSEVAVCIGILMLLLSYVTWSDREYVGRGLLWLSRYEYGIYLWHMVVIQNLIANAHVVHGFMDRGQYLLCYVLFIPASILTGFIFTELIDGHRGA